MTEPLPEICDNPLIQADDLRYYISRRLRNGDLDLYSAFMLSHEANRIWRNGYLQSAWGYELSISGLLQIYMHGVTATAFGLEGLVAIARDWFANDISLLTEKRKHFFTSQMYQLELFADTHFMTTLSRMRDVYDTLSDDDGPYHNEVFPWQYAAPEREILNPKSNAIFEIPESLDPKIEFLIGELNVGKWA